MPARDPLDELFEDLEQQAAGLHLAERDAEIAERGAAEYAAVDVAGRLHASVGRRVTAHVAGPTRIEGTLRRVGAGWFRLEAPDGEWVLLTSAVEQLSGLSGQAVSEPLRSAAARLSVRSPLRGLAESGVHVLVQLRSGERFTATVHRVGADFVEVLTADGGPQLGPVVVLLDRVAGFRS